MCEQTENLFEEFRMRVSFFLLTISINRTLKYSWKQLSSKSERMILCFLRQLMCLERAELFFLIVS